MATQSATEEKVRSDAMMDQPMTEQMAKGLGIPFDPENPPTMRQQLMAEQLASMNRLRVDAAERAKEVKVARQRLTGHAESKLTKQQQSDVVMLTEVLGLYPQILKPTLLYAATLMRRIKENEQLLGGVEDPIQTWGLYNKIQESLRQMIPSDLWPENQAVLKIQSDYTNYVLTNTSLSGLTFESVNKVVREAWERIGSMKPDEGLLVIENLLSGK